MQTVLLTNYAKGHTALAVFTLAKFSSKLPEKILPETTTVTFEGSFDKNFDCVKTAKAVCPLAKFVSKSICNYVP